MTVDLKNWIYLLCCTYVDTRNILASV